MIPDFDDIIDLYDHARPHYPQELFEDILTYSKIDPSSEILEIGAGTGQATSFFANHGYRIHALEVGQKQVSYLTEKYKSHPNVRIHREKFENAALDIKFDLLIAASSFHWIDETVRYKKSYALLNDGAALAQFWHMHPVQKYTGETFSKINDVYDIYLKGKKFYEYSELKGLIDKRMRQLACYDFKELSFHEYRYERSYSASEYIALLSTYSYVRSLGSHKEEFLFHIRKCIEEHGNTINVPAVVHLYLAKK